MLRLVAMDLEHRIGEEAAMEFKLYVAKARSQQLHIHEFMG